MFQYTFTPPINFLEYFLIQNSFYFLSSSNQKKVRAVGSFPPQNWSKLTNQTGQTHCDFMCIFYSVEGLLSTRPTPSSLILPLNLLNPLSGLILSQCNGKDMDSDQQLCGCQWRSLGSCVSLETRWLTNN